MKLVNIILAASILMLVMGSGQAAYGPITMREGANITLDGGYVIGAANATTAQGLATYSQTIGLMPFRDVKKYGAAGDGITDDTSALQAVFDDAGLIYISNGTYIIDPDTELFIRSNTTILFDPGAILKNAAHNLAGYDMLQLENVTNVNIYNPTLDGNKSGNSAVTGEWGMGIGIYSCTNVNIYNPHCINMWGDGIYLTARTGTTIHNQNIKIFNALCEYNRRQGLSIEDGKDILISNGIFRHTNGTAPQAGIDIEPFRAGQILKNVKLINPTTENNTGSGIQIYLGYIDSINDTINILIENHEDNNTPGRYKTSPSGALKIGPVRYLKGVINVIDPVWRNSYKSALVLYEKEVNAYRLNIVRPMVINPNTAGSTAWAGAATFSMVVPVGEANTYASGNISIIDPVVRKGTYAPTQTYLFYDARSNGKGFNNISVINPDGLYHVSTANCFSFAYYAVAFSKNNVSGYVRDDTEQLTWKEDAALTIGSTAYYSVIDNAKFTTTRTITWSESYPIGLSTTYRVSVAQILRIYPHSNDTIYPTGTGAGKYIQSNTVGSSITLKKVALHDWRVTNIVGTWVAE
jgi:hypothetical protein